MVENILIIISILIIMYSLYDNRKIKKIKKHNLDLYLKDKLAQSEVSKFNLDKSNLVFENILNDKKNKENISENIKFLSESDDILSIDKKFSKKMIMKFKELASNNLDKKQICESLDIGEGEYTLIQNIYNKE